MKRKRLSNDDLAISYTGTDGRIHHVHKDHLFIAMYGPDAGIVWLRTPGCRAHYEMCPATAEEITAAGGRGMFSITPRARDGGQSP